MPKIMIIATISTKSLDDSTKCTVHTAGLVDGDLTPRHVAAHAIKTLMDNCRIVPPDPTYQPETLEQLRARHARAEWAMIEPGTIICRGDEVLVLGTWKPVVDIFRPMNGLYYRKPAHTATRRSR